MGSGERHAAGRPGKGALLSPLGARVSHNETASASAAAGHPRADLPSLFRSAGGCYGGLKPVVGSPAIAVAAAAVVSVDPEGLGGLSPSSVQPCRFLTLAPIRIPLRTAAFPGEQGRGVPTPRAGPCGARGGHRLRQAAAAWQGARRAVEPCQAGGAGLRTARCPNGLLLHKLMSHPQSQVTVLYEA